MKIRQWEPSFSMRTDRQTDKTKLMTDFRNFTKAPKFKKNFVLKEAVADSPNA
jgi:hypothetical protein